jgi:hypothetical protein
MTYPCNGNIEPCLSKNQYNTNPSQLPVSHEGLVFKGCNLILLVTQDHMQNFKIVAYLLLGYFWLVKEEEEEGTDLGEIKGFLSLS